MTAEPAQTPAFTARVEEASRFLSALFEGYEEGYVEVRSFRREGDRVVNRRDFKCIPFRAVDSLAAELVRLSDINFDVYVGVLPRREQRGIADAVRSAWWMWADLDKKNLDAATINEAAEGADIAVDSGYGLHAYWRLSERMEFTSSADRLTFVKAMRALQSGVSGGVSDNVADLPRILRVPGTWNWKQGQRVPVRLLRCPETKNPAPAVAESEPMGDEELDRIREGVKDMIAAAHANAIPYLSPAWRSCRGHIVGDPNVWIRGQVTWWQFILKRQQSILAIDDPVEAVRRGAVVDAFYDELTTDFVNLFLRLDSGGMNPTGWQKNPVFTLEDIGGN